MSPRESGKARAGKVRPMIGVEPRSGTMKKGRNVAEPGDTIGPDFMPGLDKPARNRRTPSRSR